MATKFPLHVTMGYRVFDSEDNFFAEADDVAGAETIVRACNAHDALVAALRTVCDSGVQLAEPIERAVLDALKLARGE